MATSLKAECEGTKGPQWGNTVQDTWSEARHDFTSGNGAGSNGQVEITNVGVASLLVEQDNVHTICLADIKNSCRE